MRFFLSSICAVAGSLTLISSAFADSIVTQFDVESSDAVHVCGSGMTPDQNTANDLTYWVPSYSELIGAATGTVSQFKYNRLAKSRLKSLGFVTCVSAVAVDFRNEINYGTYFVQVAFSMPDAKKPKYVMSAIYRAGSVQSFEGLAAKPWYMMEAKLVSAYFKDVISQSTFLEAGNVQVGFDPVDAVKKLGLVNLTGPVSYNGGGISYTPIYGLDAWNLSGKYFLVTWRNNVEGSKVKAHRGYILKEQGNQLYYAEMDIKALSNRLELIRSESDLTEAGLDASDLAYAIEGMSVL